MSQTAIEYELTNEKPLKTLYKNKKFILLWISSLFTGLSLSMYMLTETWYVVNVLEKKSMLGFVLMATTLPRVLLLMIGGVIADRMKSSTIMFLSNSMRGILILIMIFFLHVGLLNIWLLICFALLFGILDAFFWPASTSIIPIIVDKQILTRANSIIQTTSQITTISGSVVAGWLLSISSFSVTFGFVSIILVISGILAFRINDENRVRISSGSTWGQLLEGLVYVKKSPLLISTMLLGVIVNLLFAGPVSLAGPLLVSDLFQGDIQDLSFVQSALPVGIVIGGFLVAVWNPTKKRGRVFLQRLVIMGFVLVLYSQVKELWQCILTTGWLGILIAAGIPLRSLIQENTEPDKLGRVQGINFTATTGLIPLSYALTSILLSWDISIQSILFYSGVFLILVTLLATWKFPILRKAD
ncbi:MFS transporter [Bacillus sp. CGMCC 1.16607]|uniref:MFS transporter n=1 Tax=Bacillus sp. CGMCC 1.16607 TaxID=3351842 RepID=UPI0036289BBA